MPLPLKVIVRELENEIRSDLKRVQRIVPAAASAALNRAGTRANSYLRRQAQIILGLSNQKAIKRQIRIPTRLRARRGRLKVVGVFGAYVPAVLGGTGEARIFKDRNPIKLPSTGGGFFKATLSSGHTGWFIRLPWDLGRNRIEERPRSINKWGRTELPISEVFTNETQRLIPAARDAVQEGQTRFLERFTHELKRRGFD